MNKALQLLILNRKKEYLQILLSMHYADVDLNNEKSVTLKQIKIRDEILEVLNKIKKEIEELK